MNRQYSISDEVNGQRQESMSVSLEHNAYEEVNAKNNVNVKTIIKRSR